MTLGRVTRVLLLGGGRVLVTIAERLHERKVPVSVITSPRHAVEHVGDFTLQERLAKSGITTVSTERVADDPAVAPQVTASTLALSFGAAWIFRQPFIDRFGGRLLNVHGAPLPRHRGAGGFSWRILMDDRDGACLIHRVVEAVDAGEVIAEEPYRFPEDCRLPRDFERFQQDRDIDFVLRFIDDALAGKRFETRVQDERAALYFPRLYTPVHGAIDWRWSAADIDRFIRAFDEPYAGALTTYEGAVVHLRGSRLADAERFHPFQAGYVYRTSAAIFIAAAGGGLAVEKVIDGSGTDVTATIAVGHRFVTSDAMLEKAREFRAVYTPKGIKL